MSTIINDDKLSYQITDISYSCRPKITIGFNYSKNLINKHFKNYAKCFCDKQSYPNFEKQNIYINENFKIKHKEPLQIKNKIISDLKNLAVKCKISAKFF